MSRNRPTQSRVRLGAAEICLFSLVRSRRGPREPRFSSRRGLRLLRLLELDLGAGLLELGLDLLGLVLRHAFLDGLWRAFDQVLGFLQAQAGDGADLFDDFDFLVAGSSEDNSKFILLLTRCSSSTSRPSRNRNSSSSRNAPLLFQQ